MGGSLSKEAAVPLAVMWIWGAGEASLPSGKAGDALGWSGDRGQSPPAAAGESLLAAPCCNSHSLSFDVPVHNIQVGKGRGDAQHIRDMIHNTECGKQRSCLEFNERSTKLGYHACVTTEQTVSHHVISPGQPMMGLESTTGFCSPEALLTVRG